MISGLSGGGAMFLPAADAVWSSTPGTPCWIDLAVPDTTTACEFYGPLLGWDFHVKRDPVGADGRYVLALRGDVQVAGLYTAAEGDSLGWSLHLRVADAANTAEWVDHLGGSVLRGPLDVPGRGTLLHALDPSGAPVVFWETPPNWFFGTHLPGMFTGADLNTVDGAAADEFYSRLFGYSVEHIGEDGIDYAVWRIGHEIVLHRCVLDSSQPQRAAITPPTARTDLASPHWLVYFEADPAVGTDALTYTAIELGGGMLVEPHDTPFGRTALLLDPHGSPFAVIDHSRTVDLGAGRAEVDDPYDD
jgi:predicted enzyme related to lactoylglutathione lyase